MDNCQSNASDIPVRLMNWALLWSPLQDDEAFAMAWNQLSRCLPVDATLRQTFVKTFIIDLPRPHMPLTFSNALQRESGACHEDWMRVSQQLGLERAGPVLPPDHLALACELLAHAWARDDSILIQGMLDRYLLPWVTLALERVNEPLLTALVVPFKRDIERVLH